MSKPIRSLLKFLFVFWIFSSTLFLPANFRQKTDHFHRPGTIWHQGRRCKRRRQPRPDLVQGGPQCREIHLGDGNGRFAGTGPVYDTLLGAASEFEVADMDRDGHADIVAAGGHGIAVLRGNGDGTFQTPILFNIVSSSDPNDPARTVNSLALGGLQ